MPRATWVTTRLDRARRRFGAPTPAPVDAAVPVSDFTVSVVRSDLERLMTALAATLAPDQPRPDSPARLAAALASAITRVDGHGEPLVTRSPAGLHTPECWHIRIDRADDRTRAAFTRLAAGEPLV